MSKALQSTGDKSHEFGTRAWDPGKAGGACI